MLRKILVLTLFLTLYSSFAHAVTLRERNLDNVAGLGMYGSLNYIYIPNKAYDITDIATSFTTTNKGTGFDLNIGASRDFFAIEISFITTTFDNGDDTKLDISEYRLGASLMPKIPVGHSYIFPYIGGFYGNGSITNILKYYERKVETTVYGGKIGIKIPFYRPDNFLVMLISSVFLDANIAYTTRSYKYGLDTNRLQTISSQIGLGVSF